MSTITKIYSRYVYDSRGNPTVEVELTTPTGLFRAIVPSGASTGSHEAVELRDGDKSKWGGKGVLKAVANVNDVIAPALIKEGIPVTEQKKLDEFMIALDGTRNKAKLGANAILGVSLAATKAAAAYKKIPLYEYMAILSGNKTSSYVMPVPFMNVLNGGKHAGGKLALQEFMIAPVGASSFHEALELGTEVYHELKNLAKKEYGQSAANVGDEGGVAPDIESPEKALDLVYGAIKAAGHEDKVCIGMDPASSEFFVDGKYDLDFKDPKEAGKHLLSGDEMGELYRGLLAKYPIVLLEDPFAEDDWESWTSNFPKFDVEIVGDDLTVTNAERIKTAIEKKTCDGLLLKVNQIGTLTEAFESANLAYSAGWGIFVSHRSGETEDTTIADLTVGLRTGHLKSGAPARSERVSKYNQLLRIEDELGDKAIYAGRNFHKAHLM